MTPAPLLQRIDRSPLAFHAAALLLVLVLLTLTLDVSRGVYDADEGALLMQVRILAADGEWYAPLPTADLDPDGTFAAVANARIDSGTIAPFPLRPALVTLTTALWKLGDVLAATLPGLLGLMVTAAVAADLAGRIDSRARTLTFWVTGLASPLLFQSFALQGHAPAAGLLAVMLWCSIRASEQPVSMRLGFHAGALVSGVGAALFRREAVVLAGAWILATAIEDLRGRRLRHALPAVTALAGTLLGTLADRALSRELIGAGAFGTPLDSAESVVVDRVLGLLTLVNPGYEGDPAVASFLAVASAVVLVVAVVRFRARGDRSELVVGATLSAGLLVLRLVVGSRYMIQGLIPAFPLGVAAFLLSAPSREEVTMRLLRSAATLFVVGVGLSQYRAGGGFEWASRYTAIGVPVALPVIGVVMARLPGQLDLERRTAIVAGLSLAVITFVPPTMGLVAQHHARRNNAASVTLIEQVARSGDTDLVVSTHPEIPRANPDQLEGDLRWMWIPPEYFPVMLPRLREAGIDQVVLITKEPDEALDAATGEGWEVHQGVVRQENPGRALFALMRVGSDGG